MLFTASTVKITIAATNAADWMMQTAPPLRKLRKTPRIPAARVSARCAGGGLSQRTPCRAPNPRPPAVAGAAVHCSATVLWSGDRTIPELLNLYIDTVFVLLPPAPCWKHLLADPWNNGKEVPRLDLTSLTTPGQQIRVIGCRVAVLRSHWSAVPAPITKLHS